MEPNELSLPPQPRVLLTCVSCGALHEPRRPLGRDLNPRCGFCSPPELVRRPVGPFD